MNSLEYLSDLQKRLHPKPDYWGVSNPRRQLVGNTDELSFWAFRFFGDRVQIGLDNGDDLIFISINPGEFSKMVSGNFLHKIKGDWRSQIHRETGKTEESLFIEISGSRSGRLVAPAFEIDFEIHPEDIQHLTERGYLATLDGILRTKSFEAMPIDYSKYCDDWKLRSRFIRFQRAQGKCENCGAVHGEPHPITGSMVQLHCAHLDHDITHNSLLNLKALCQKCHARYDSSHHSANRKRKTYERKHPGQMTLF